MTVIADSKDAYKRGMSGTGMDAESVDFWGRAACPSSNHCRGGRDYDTEDFDRGRSSCADAGPNMKLGITDYGP